MFIEDKSCPAAPDYTPKKGDEIIARSKTDPHTVLHGDVGYLSDHYVNVKPKGHMLSNNLELSEWTFEKVAPPIKFGPFAVVRSRIDKLVRDEHGTWFYITGIPGVVSVGDDYWEDKVRQGRSEVLSYGIGVEPHESWPKAIAP